ncbi:MAG: sulfatase-like hydrolase/transferase [Candidatus Micrarchaeia archaeon]
MKPNIAIIVADTLRLDAFNSIEAKFHSFGKMGFSFYGNCIAPSSWTLPSHASLFTGMYPSEHGAHESRSVKSLDIDRIKLRMPTFVSDLNRMGYSTYAISANPYVSPVYGFSEFRSFMEESYFTDVFGSTVEVSRRLKPIIAKYRNVYGNSIAKIALHAMIEDPSMFMEALASAAMLTPKSALIKAKAKLIDGWPIEKGGRRIAEKIEGMKMKTPFFLFVNLMEAHDPYVGKKSMDFDWSTPFMRSKPSSKLVSRWRRLYHIASERAYRYSARIAESVADDNAVVLFTSDHGQLLGEHGFYGHGTVLYDEAIKVPLALRMPEEVYAAEGYQSLANVRKFVTAVARGQKGAASLLTSKEVISESFGIPANISMVKGVNRRLISKFERESVRRFSWRA